MGIFAARQKMGNKDSVSLFYKDRGISVLDARFDSALRENTLSLMDYQSLVGVTTNGMVVSKHVLLAAGGFDTSLESNGKNILVKVVEFRVTDPIQDDIAQSSDFCMKVKKMGLKIEATNNIIFSSLTIFKKKKDRVNKQQ